MKRPKTCPRNLLCTRCGKFGLFTERSNGARSALCSVCDAATTHSGMHAETPIDGPPLAKKPRRRRTTPTPPDPLPPAKESSP